MSNKNNFIPWDEIFDRLYHRQDPPDIVNDLVKRGRIDQDGYDEALNLVNSLKQKMDLLRLGQ